MEKEISKSDAKQRIEKLRKVIDDLRYRYHVLDDPTVTDADYDYLMKELVELERKYPEFLSSDSPSQKVAGEPLKKFRNVAHKHPMLSLNDAFDEQELKDWYNRVAKLSPENTIGKSGFYCELKMDGLAVSLMYKNGELEYALTRGNGKVGEDVTHNIRTIKSIPLKLREESKYYSSVKGKTVEIRGEVYMPTSSFDALNKERAKKKEALFANPRNAAAGSLRQLDPKISASRNLNFMGYAFLGIETETHEEEHGIITNLGLPTNNHNKFCHSIEEIMKLWHEWEEKRSRFPYQIDGMVININDKKVFAKLGVVGKAPRGAIAFKWPAEEVATTVEDITVQVGRTGTLTPVAHLKPVLVAGSTVSRATLHNQDEIDFKDIRIGDTVVIRKAGDVIPEVVKPIIELRNGRERKFKMPLVCPMCGGKVERKEGESAYRCLNMKCYAIQFRGLTHFVSKTAFDIDGLGPKIIEKLLTEGLIKDASDIFTLTKGDLEPLERFAEKSAQNAIGSIEQSKKIDLSRFIYALGIRNVGEETAIDIADVVNLKLTQQCHPRLDLGSSNYCIDSGSQATGRNDKGSLWNIFSEVSLEEWQSIYDIGPVVAKSIYEYFNNQKNINFIQKLIDNGVKIIPPEKREEKANIAGKTFVFTGGLDLMTRDDAKALARKYGGNVSESVSANVDYVVAGEEAGSKLEKAKKNGVKILSEEEFITLIK